MNKVYTELCEKVCTHGKQLDVGGVRTLRVHPEPLGCTVPVRCFPAAARSDHLGKVRFVTRPRSADGHASGTGSLGGVILDHVSGAPGQPRDALATGVRLATLRRASHSLAS